MVCLIKCIVFDFQHETQAVLSEFEQDPPTYPHSSGASWENQGEALHWIWSKRTTKNCITQYNSKLSHQILVALYVLSSMLTSAQRLLYGIVCKLYTLNLHYEKTQKKTGC